MYQPAIPRSRPWIVHLAPEYGDLLGGNSRGAGLEVVDDGQFLVAVLGHQLPHRLRHPGVRWSQVTLRGLRERLDDDGAAIRGMRFAAGVATRSRRSTSPVMAPVVRPVNSA